ncbi:hypothetical protein QBC38DRAFT_183263 [Podospora fimiseda]|uniref:Tyrosinase copper-binding domain-containing protein n=1 Tax=Podospora fimiseda TaxID=252190 RepID=A0AAN7BQM1_9PEZI|nr:hypothetical protein QBC38DRAFT_183263 [Podospora fimiseda]
MPSFHTLIPLFSLLLGVAKSSPVEKKSAGWTYNPVRNPDLPPDEVDLLLDSTIPKVQAYLERNAGSLNNCTIANAAVRREWSDLSLDERKEYVRAVLCLQSLPSRSAALGKAPGARSRFDDFVATHMEHANQLHGPTTLLAGHRYFVWAYETALREECGYKGYQPYMNYDRYAKDPLNSLLFDGSEGSMSGDGLYVPYPGIPSGMGGGMIPNAGGGGCVTTGPFKDMVVSLGPKGGLFRDITKNGRADGLAPNPRCLRRDVNAISAMGGKANYTYSLITEHNDIDAFYNRYLGMPQLRGDPYGWGVHMAGHYLIGGDPGGDFYCSPGDPLFYFHHGMLDRIWWLWQMQDPERRINAVPFHPETHDTGHGGIHGREDILDSIIDLGWTAGPVTLRSQNNQLGGHGGQYCYIYV